VAWFFTNKTVLGSGLGSFLLEPSHLPSFARWLLIFEAISEGSVFVRMSVRNSAYVVLFVCVTETIFLAFAFNGEGRILT